MNQDLKKLRRIVFEANLQRRLHVMHTRKRHIVGQRAMARDIKPGTDFLELKLVDVNHFRKFLHNLFEPLFQFGLENNLLTRFDRCRLAFNMGENGRNFRNLGAHLGFEARHFIVRLFHAEALIEFEVLLYVQLTVQVLHADVMYVEIVSSRDCANPIENILCLPGPWNRVHNHIGRRKDLAHPRLHSV